MPSPPVPRKGTARRQPRPAIPSNSGGGGQATGLRPRKRAAEEAEAEEPLSPGQPASKKPLLFGSPSTAVIAAEDGHVETSERVAKDANVLQSSCLTRYRHATLNRGQVKAVLEGAFPAGVEVTPAMVVVAAGAAKVFAAQLIEEARLVQLQWSTRGAPAAYDIAGLEPLRPQHVMEAYRRMQQSRRVPAAPRIQPSLLLL